MFEAIQAAPPDPILGLAEAFGKDPHPEKINLAAGIYKDDEGKTPTLDCIVRAEDIIAESATSGGGASTPNSPSVYGAGKTSGESTPGGGPWPATPKPTGGGGCVS